MEQCLRAGRRGGHSGFQRDGRTQQGNKKTSLERRWTLTSPGIASDPHEPQTTQTLEHARGPGESALSPPTLEPAPEPPSLGHRVKHMGERHGRPGSQAQNEALMASPLLSSVPLLT